MIRIDDVDQTYRIRIKNEMFDSVFDIKNNKTQQKVVKIDIEAKKFKLAKRHEVENEYIQFNIDLNLKKL